MKSHFLKKQSLGTLSQATVKEGGIGAPLKNPIFCTLWIANFISNLGNIMQGVAAAWLMTSLTHSPFLIGLVLTAFNLPIFLFGVPCGVLADLFNRRYLLIVAQLLMMSVSVTMVVLAVLGIITAPELLAFIFLLGVGTALHLPAWMALLQDLVAEQHLAAAVSLNSIGYNLARTLGPALGGFCIHFIGVPLAFLSDAFSYLVVLFGLMRIPVAQLPKPPTEKPTLKRFFQALWDIKTFVVTSSVVPGLLLRLSLFTIGNAGVLGLLPFIVREELHLGVNNYGGFLSCFGMGSVLGALCLPRLRRYLSVNTIVNSGIILSAGSIFSLAYSTTFFAVAFCMGLFGVSWIVVLVNYNISLQLTAPACLKGRMISLYVVFFQGGIGIGSGLGGWIADGWGTRKSLILEAVLVLSSLLLIPIFALSRKKPV